MNKAINIVCVCVCLICAATTLFNLRALAECKGHIDILFHIADAQTKINDAFKDSLFK